MTQKQIWKIRKRTQRKYLITDESKCYKCGATVNLQRHHEKGLLVDIVKIACPKCHFAEDSVTTHFRDSMGRFRKYSLCEEL